MLSSLPGQVNDFVQSCRLSDSEFAFSSSPGSEETLYASCFAAMILHYTGALDGWPLAVRQKWGAYINSWQREDGLFIGPELIPEEISSRKHSFEHISHHLTAHALPALDVLGEHPSYPLHFANKYMDRSYLQAWLQSRDWRDAWLEGNNLLFVAQFLVHLRDVEGKMEAGPALNYFFSWLDHEVDPETGLWGTNGYCSIPAALYGGYHQLLAYFHEDRTVSSPRRLLDVALSLQHADGGFHPAGGGGACEDVDAIDILVNLYKRFNYKRPQIRLALRRALEHVLTMQETDGGFIYRRNESFIHMGIARTASKPNESNLFPTWFRVHSLALIEQVLKDDDRIRYPWRFNQKLSMGWHRRWDISRHKLTSFHKLQERGYKHSSRLTVGLKNSLRTIRNRLGQARRNLTGHS